MKGGGGGFKRCLLTAFKRFKHILFTRHSSRGVAILFKNNFDYWIDNVTKDGDGNLFGLDVNIEDRRFTLINVYGPNVYTPFFLLNINRNHNLCGDFNLIQKFNHV